MARVHRNVVIGTTIVFGASLCVGALVYGVYNSIGSNDAEQNPPPRQASAFTVKVGPEPAIEEPEPERPKQETRIQLTREPQKAKTQTAVRKPSLTDKWLDKVNSGGMYAFGNDNGYSGVHGEGGDCQITQPVRVRAMIADSASTDTPGMAIGAISEDVQGTFSDGEWCVAIHAMSVVSFNVDKAGDYATNRAPVTVGNIWMQDGFSISVNQPAKHIDGSIGVIGKANHHTFSKTIAAIAGGTFRLLDNVTSFGQYNMSSGDVTGPFEKKLDKKLNRPSEITFTGGKVVEFDVMPVSTPGY